MHLRKNTKADQCQPALSQSQKTLPGKRIYPYLMCRASRPRCFFSIHSVIILCCCDNFICPIESKRRQLGICFIFWTSDPIFCYFMNSDYTFVHLHGTVSILSLILKSSCDRFFSKTLKMFQISYIANINVAPKRKREISMTTHISYITHSFVVNSFHSL